MAVPHSDSTPDWVSRDREVLWHPYSSVGHPAPLYPVVSARGATLTLSDGRTLIDGMASWWSVIHGYNHPELNQAIEAQLAKMAHVMFGGLTHEPAILLAEKLVELSPSGLDKVFFSDSGSVAVEVAIKMALQYWQSNNKASKTKLMSLRRGYHGDTFQAMSVCDPETGMHHLFTQVLSQQIFTESPRVKFDQPWSDAYFEDFQHTIEQHKDQLAAVILEPIVQGTGGMNFYSPEFLRQVRRACDQADVLLIADEIATGFGRTGKMFACEHSGITPDILCLGKSLTGGYLTLAATLCTNRVAEGISNGSAGVFMHGPTFMGNPLACAVALKSIELIESSNLLSKLPEITSTMQRLLEPCASFQGVTDVRVLGGIGVVEMSEPLDLSTHQDMFVQEGIWVRPFGRLVYIMPPLIISQDSLTQLCEALVRVVQKIGSNFE